MLHTRNCRNQSGRPFIGLNGIATSYVGYIYLLKWLSFSKYFFFYFLLVRVELRRYLRTNVLCVQDTESLDHIFPPCHVEKSGLFDLFIRTDFIQPYLIQAWMKIWMKGNRGHWEIIKYFLLSFVSDLWSIWTYGNKATVNKESLSTTNVVKVL